MTYVRRTTSLAETAQIEKLNAEVAKLTAYLDYVCMVADIDIPVDESVDMVEGEVE